jgi:hypothetical protein
MFFSIISGEQNINQGTNQGKNHWVEGIII